ncbi:hypothetical protein N7492_005664 [Penicillium capsulatum]|uniref:Malate dehydrogenase n=1 Tax=Penicillium capsulatum TaxID=69766 RepID=A0A9W9ICV8_9EURO|nr:hypothetical protein N7492_005664 [Penicillium capsulatum]KAJ6135239.1 hypothetical protein N7512_000399 [Penicillium capsulatum]
MQGALVLLAALILTVTGAAHVLPGPLRLADTFSHIAKDLDHINLGKCSLEGITLPLNKTKVKLPKPSSHLDLKHVVIGRGTQNYTCPSSGMSTKLRRDTSPEATGAAAALFDASCIAAASPNILHELPAVLGKAPLGSLVFLSEILSRTTTTSELIIGEHYFNSDGEPLFNLGLSDGDSWLIAKKNSSVEAPTRVTSPSRESNIQDVPWLKLGYNKGKGLKEVYRVMTFEGAAPSTCEGQNGTIVVDYAAEYWFYG